MKEWTNWSDEFFICWHCASSSWIRKLLASFCVMFVWSKLVVTRRSLSKPLWLQYKLINGGLCRSLGRQSQFQIYNNNMQSKHNKWLRPSLIISDDDWINAKRAFYCGLLLKGMISKISNISEVVSTKSKTK